MESREDHLEKMKRYVVITQKLIAEQDIKCKTLTDEVEACHRMIQSLQLNAREEHGAENMQQEVKSVSQFRLKERPSVREILVRVKHDATSGHNVILEETDGVHSVYRVFLSKSDPCSSPIEDERAVKPKVVVDPAQSMCDIWEGVYNMKKEKMKSDRAS
jgi:hypothetical protein